jgi:hypothetical protein
MTQIIYWFICPFRLSLHVVGIGVCVVVLTPFDARRAQTRNSGHIQNWRYTNDTPPT